ncbi:MAG TPA: hypothetical protein ENG09_06530 [Candidatus Syntrophoarchaeum butanivorans]|uniref:Uncharacterized protein n=1 Tax=Candidatus Syntropharchaeum butanivorans TaxID=1839936 RepID=A0A7C1B4F1_9EURY|nr:hypothetical protein [Candidatus Syntrophoarchaeum butanivorans]
MVKVKLKKKGEEEAQATPSSGEGKEILDMIAGLNRLMKKVESIRGIDLEFDEIILEGVMPPYELLSKLLSAAPPAVGAPAPAAAAEVAEAGAGAPTAGGAAERSFESSS